MKSLHAAVVSGNSSGREKTASKQLSPIPPPPTPPPPVVQPSPSFTTVSDDEKEGKKKDAEKENNAENAERMAENKDDLQPTTTSALNIVTNIKSGLRDDGIFGLNWAKKLIGGQKFQIENQELRVQTGDQQWQIFHIYNDDVWKMLFMQNPSKEVLVKTADGELTPAAKQYKDIVGKLKLVEHAQRSNHLKGYRKRRKYKDIISVVSGTGFMYSLHQPSSFKNRKRAVGGTGLESPTTKIGGKKRRKLSQFHPSTVVIPSDKNGLLCALVKAMAELKAGNTSMRNLVVPLIAEAKRRGILPREYDNDVKDMNWVYA